MEKSLDFSVIADAGEKTLDFPVIADTGEKVPDLSMAADAAEKSLKDLTTADAKEKSLDFPTIAAAFGMACPDANGYSSLALAYIGDCVYDLVIRSIVVAKNHTSVNDLHHKTIHYVKAESQALMADALKEDLTPEETDVYRRARNAKSNTKAKNASIVAYRKATGLEALIGWLYIQNHNGRILELITLGLSRTETEI